VTSYIWGYNNTFPIAIVTNATPSQVYHTSFEELTTSDVSTISKTGNKSYGGTTAFTVPLPSAGTYKLTYWMKNGPADWQYVEDTMSAAKMIGGNGILIDEVRVYPQNAQMITYTYDVLLGMTSMMDANNTKNSYGYDSFGRLISVKDLDENLVKVFEYHYKN